MSIDISQRLRQLKQKKGYSYADIAEKTGFSAGYISNIHRGKTVGIENLEKICSAIGITLSDFFQADMQPVDINLLESARGLSESKKQQLAQFLDGLKDK